MRTTLGYLLATLTLTASAAYATTFTVNENDLHPDAAPGDGVCADSSGDCTLLAAIQEADALAGADTIEIPAIYGPYFAEDYLITGAVTLRGLGAGRVEIFGKSGSRLFTIDPPSGAFVDIVFEHLHLRDGSPAGIGTQRGGIAYVEAGHGRIRFTDCRLSGGTADEGGALFLSGGLNSFTIEDSELWSSFATTAGGAIYLNGGTLVIRRTELASNESAIDGGALFVRNFASPSTLVTDSTLRNNVADAGGGAIAVQEGSVLVALTLVRTLVDGNRAEDGGGIDARGGRVSLVDSELTANQALDLGGSGGQQGGGLRVLGPGAGDVPVVTVEGTTWSGNTATFGGAVLVANGILSMANSTVSGNDGATSGGGVFAGFFGLVELANVTVTGNEAAPGNPMAGDGGGLFVSGGLIETRNSLVAGNEARRSGTGGSVKEDADCDGTITSLGYNLIGTTEGCTLTGDTTGNLTDFNVSLVQLGTLADNGGPTATHGIGATSVARDAADPTGCAWDDDGSSTTPPVTLATDQRGYLRSDSRCDAGAFELDAVPQLPIFSDGFESGDTGAWNPGVS